MQSHTYICMHHTHAFVHTFMHLRAGPGILSHFVFFVFFRWVFNDFQTWTQKYLASSFFTFFESQRMKKTHVHNYSTAILAVDMTSLKNLLFSLYFTMFLQNTVFQHFVCNHEYVLRAIRSSKNMICLYS